MRNVDALVPAGARRVVASLREWLRSQQAKRVGMTLGLALLASGAYVSVNALPGGFQVPAPEYLVYLVFIGTPFLILATTLETRLSASLLGGHFGWIQSLRIATLSSAANILPLPGGPMVRIAALKSIGLSLKASGAVTLAIALLWLGQALAYAGAWLAFDAHWLAWPFLSIGLPVLGVSVLWLRRLSGGWIGPLQVFAVKALSMGAGIFRVALALLALGVGVDLASLSIFAVSSVSGAAVTVVPAGIGVTETVAATLASLVAIPAAAAFLAATIARVAELAVQCSIAVGLLMVGDKSRAW